MLDLGKSNSFAITIKTISNNLRPWATIHNSMLDKKTIDKDGGLKEHKRTCIDFFGILTY